MEILQNIIYYIVPFIILLGILVFVHEFGHFIIARLCGVSVSVFSIGFGKELWSHTDKHGTAWKLCAVPLGGYCQFLGDGDASSSTEGENLNQLTEEEKKHAFAFQNNWKKLAIVLAGPMFNYLFAIVVFIGIFYGIGKVVYPPVVGDVLAGEAADLAGIKAGDKIVSINGRPTPDFMSISNEVALSTEDDIIVQIERPMSVTLKTAEVEVPTTISDSGKAKILGFQSMEQIVDPQTGKVSMVPPVLGDVVPSSPADIIGFAKGDIIENVNGVKFENFEELKDYVSDNIDAEFLVNFRRPMTLTATLKETDFDDGSGNKIKRRMLGVMSASGVVFSDEKMTFGQAVKDGFSEAYSLTTTTLRAVGQMITGQRGGKDVGGIIRIAEMSGDVSKNGGLIGFLYFMALLSVNLGLINLLPIPVLDGGHVVIFLCEIVTRRELKPQIKDYIFKFGLFIILGIMVLATWNDVVHLFERWFD